MKYAYFPGCSLHSTGKEYDHSLKAVCKALDIQLESIPNWLCCGSTPAHATSRLLAAALPMKNIADFEKAGFKELVVPCAACFSRFKTAQHEMVENEQLAASIREIVEHTFGEDFHVMHPLEVFSQDPLMEQMAGLVKKRLPDLKVACYYGCLLTRPPKITHFDECEYPKSMDRILNAVGVATVDWTGKTDCCGTSFSLTQKDLVLKLSNDVLQQAQEAGAQAISVACSLCHVNLDTRQREIEAKYSKKYDMPILYFTQLMGLAMGLPEKELSLASHFVPTAGILKQAAAV